MNPSDNSLMQAIQVSSFALDDLALFLNTHPDCREAITLYDEQKALRSQAVRDYTERCGPLTHYQVDTRQGWSWAETPWPWEGGC